MKILVIQQKMIGDVLISSIICDNLRKAYPDAIIDYLVNPNTTPILEGNPNISNIVLFTPEADRNFFNLIQFGLQIRKQQYDLVIDAYSKLQSWTISLLSGAKQKISYKKKGRNWIYTDNIIQEKYPKSNLGLAIERRLSLLDPLNLNIELETFPKLYLTEKEKLDAKKLFETHQVNPDRKTIMVSLIGSEKIKTYPLHYMAELINLVGDNYDVNILFNYFPNQIQDAQTVYKLCSKITRSKIHFDLLGNDLRSFIAIMDRCDFIFGNDGGAINIAKSLKKPSFIIFSPWIEKKIWATFEDGINHDSTHLNDFLPEIFENRSYGKLKKLSLDYYEKFKPKLFQEKLIKFINKHL